MTPQMRAVADLAPQRLAELVPARSRARVELPASRRILEAAAVTVLPAADARTHTVRVRAGPAGWHRGCAPRQLRACISRARPPLQHRRADRDPWLPPCCVAASSPPFTPPTGRAASRCARSVRPRAPGGEWVEALRSRWGRDLAPTWCRPASRPTRRALSRKATMESPRHLRPYRGRFPAQRDHATAGAGAAAGRHLRHADHAQGRRAADRRHHGQRAGALPGASAATSRLGGAAGRAGAVAHGGRRAHLFTVSRPGMAVITVQFEVGVPNQTALVRLYDTVHSHADWLSPQLGVGQPVIKPRASTTCPSSADAVDRRSRTCRLRMQQVARAIETELKRIPGTRDVATIGGPGHVIRVDGHRAHERARRHRAGPARRRCSCRQRLAAGGAAWSRATSEVLVQTGTYLESAEDVRNWSWASPERRPVFPARRRRGRRRPDQPGAYVWFGTGAAARKAASISTASSRRSPWRCPRSRAPMPPTSPRRRSAPW